MAVISLIENNPLEPGMFTYQFTYFSMDYIFFALLPMAYPGGTYSDGKLILNLIRNQKHLGEKTYRIHWDKDKSKWCVLDHKRNLVQAFQDEEKALEKAQEVAQKNRPSRLINSKSGEEKEVGKLSQNTFIGYIKFMKSSFQNKQAKGVQKYHCYTRQRELLRC